MHVFVSRGKEDVAIKVVDEGGGIKRSSLPRIWSYFYGTGCTIERGKYESGEKAPPLRNRFGKTLQGSRMGLPLARLSSCYCGEPLLFPLLLLLLFPVPLRTLYINTFPFSCTVLPSRQQVETLLSNLWRELGLPSAVTCMRFKRIAWSK